MPAGGGPRRLDRGGLTAPVALAVAVVGIIVFGLLRRATARTVAAIYPAAHGLVVFALALAA